jgi:hypothetical protein
MLIDITMYDDETEDLSEDYIPLLIGFHDDRGLMPYCPDIYNEDMAVSF